MYVIIFWVSQVTKDVKNLDISKIMLFSQLTKDVTNLWCSYQQNDYELLEDR